jgi:hypothetical protein
MGQLLKLLLEFLYEAVSALLKFFTVASFKELTVTGFIVGGILLGLFVITRKS